MLDIGTKTTVSKLPASVQSLLREMGCAKRFCYVRFADTFHVPGSYGDGYRAVWGTVALDGSRVAKVVRGSWGGPNPFCRGIERAQNDAEGAALPMVPGIVAAEWMQGGMGTSKPTIIAHPADAAPLLPA